MVRRLSRVQDLLVVLSGPMVIDGFETYGVFKWADGLVDTNIDRILDIILYQPS